MFLLSPMLITYKLKIIPNYKAKQWMLSYFFSVDQELNGNTANKRAINETRIK
jgi:hypothetical protein